MLCASGQTPQMRFVISAISSMGRPTHKSLEAAQFRDLEIRIGYIALIVEEDFDLAMTFQTGNGIDANSLCHNASIRARCIVLLTFPQAGFAAFINDPAKLNR